jgi:hypothetical protein
MGCRAAAKGRKGRLLPVAGKRPGRRRRDEEREEEDVPVVVYVWKYFHCGGGR